MVKKIKSGGNVARFLFFRQKGFLLLLVLSFAVIISGCGHKAPPVPPGVAFLTVMEFHETALGDNGNYLKT
jgi:hypothetical protein